MIALVSLRTDDKKQCLWKVQTSFSGICISQLKEDIARKSFCKKKMIFGRALYIFSRKTFAERIITLQGLHIKK